MNANLIKSPSRSYSNKMFVRTNSVSLLRFYILQPYCGECNGNMSVGITGLALHICTSNRRASTAIFDSKGHRLTDMGDLGPRHLQKGVRPECVESPQHLVRSLHLLLAPTDGRELIVKEDTPELGVRLALARDRLDKEVIELCGKGPATASSATSDVGFSLRHVPVEPKVLQLGCIGERAGARRAGGGVCREVRAVAVVFPAQCRRDVVASSKNRALEDGLMLALDAQVYNGSLVGIRGTEGDRC